MLSPTYSPKYHSLRPLGRNRIMLACRARRFHQRRFHVLQRDVAQLDLLRAEAIEHRADQVVFRNGASGSLANGFFDLFVHDGFLLEHSRLAICVSRTGILTSAAYGIYHSTNATDVPRRNKLRAGSVVSADTMRTSWFTRYFVLKLGLFANCD